MIKRLIFDVDNTLITNIDFTNYIKNTLNDLDIYTIEVLNNFLNAISEYEKYYNNYNKYDYINFISSYINIQLDSNFLDIFFDNLKYAIPKNNELLINCISALASSYELVLLTNYFRESQMNRLNNMGIGNFFNYCYGEELIKPNKQAYINACGKYKPYECVMIGDDVYLDCIIPKELELNTILVNNKNININTMVVNNVEDINLELIKKLRS
jgi:FMN phosphatase YigB (HAD superfamily)